MKYDLQDIPIVLVGNKCDLESLREVTSEEANNYAKMEKFKFFEASAKTKQNVEECFFDVVRKIRDLRKPSKKEKKSNCKIL